MSRRLFRFLAVAAAFGGAVPAASAAPTPNIAYVALGDSYSAGPGINPQRANAGSCARSEQNYPSMIAAQYWLGAPSSGNWNDYTCSGAKISDLVAQANLAASDNVLGEATKAVTFTIGGNDSFTSGHRSLWDSLLNCVWHPVSPCQNDPALLKQSELSKEVFASRVSPAINAIRFKAPNAKILILSYPTIVPRAGQLGCRDTSSSHAWDLGMSEAAYLDGVIAKFLAIQKDAAATLLGPNVQVVDTYTPSANSHFCPSATARWIQTPNVSNPGQLHPNVLGMTNFASLAIAKFGA